MDNKLNFGLYYAITWPELQGFEDIEDIDLHSMKTHANDEVFLFVEKDFLDEKMKELSNVAYKGFWDM